MDAIKLVFKEDITVRASEKIVYIMAPVISVFCALLIFAVIPFGPATRIPFTHEITPLQLTDFPVAVLYILACASIGVYGIVLGGWASGSTYPLMGSVRSTAQVISYELAMGLSLVTVFMLSGSMSTSQIVDSQTNRWWVWPLFPAFILYVISMIGETNRLPFDLPEAEGELVAGFMTEYSSTKFAWYFLAEYMNMINVSAIAATLFLGGWRAPWGATWPGADDSQLRHLPARVAAPQDLAHHVRLRVDPRLGAALPLRPVHEARLEGAHPVWAWLARVLRYRPPGVRRMGSQPRYVRRRCRGSSRSCCLSAVWSFLSDSNKDKQSPEEGDSEPELLDAFAGGYPVPPLPHQVLPPSPRSGRTVEARVAARSDATQASEEQGDE